MNRIRLHLIVMALGSLVLHSAAVSAGDARKDSLIRLWRVADGKQLRRL
jgi:hypothetical protein